VVDKAKLPERVTICEVGPRDGLQNERGKVIATDDKLRFVELLTDAGLTYVETTSFVSPRWVPQLADHDDMMRRLVRRPSVRYPVLVPNQRGLDGALASGCRAICVFTGATETFTQRNINRTIQESLDRFAPIVARAKQEGLWVRAYLSCAFGCPYEGDVDLERVLDLLDALTAMGCDELSVGDTIGVADPAQVTEVVRSIRDRLGLDTIAMHFHDTRGTAIANVCAALVEGVTIFDTACGGLGGCPYAPGASGNLATEDLLYLLNRLGIETGVDIDKVSVAARFIQEKLGRALPGRMIQALNACAQA
jgi:hydroxymethylglutaryl-CoA lyase